MSIDKQRNNSGESCSDDFSEVNMDINLNRMESVQFGVIDHHDSRNAAQVMEKEEIKDFLFMVSGVAIPKDDDSGTFDTKA